MSSKHRIARDRNGEAVVTITLTGESDIHRFAYNLLSQQVEFAAMGRNILKSQRRRLGKARWVGMWHTFHGEQKPLTFSWKRDL